VPDAKIKTAGSAAFEKRCAHGPVRFDHIVSFLATSPALAGLCFSVFHKLRDAITGCDNSLTQILVAW
jgi:hypothetical protein